MNHPQRFHLVPLRAARDDFAGDVRRGLAAAAKQLPCKYFYDETGSKIFEQICELPEYYLPRTETAILEQHAHDIIELCASPRTLVELGCGNSKKTQFLIDACLAKRRELTFCGIDIEPECLKKGARRLLESYPTLRVLGLAGEFNDGLAYLADQSPPTRPEPAGKSAVAAPPTPTTDAPRLVAFLGSTLGNFDAQALDEFLSMVRGHLHEHDRLLLGIDLIKDPAELIAAYDDAQGVTARFNRNLLARINRELDANFDLALFRHEARFHPKLARIEMHLVSVRPQTVTVRAIDLTVSFQEGESIHTENCHKFSIAGTSEALQRAGLTVVRPFTDPLARFCLLLAAPRESLP